MRRAISAGRRNAATPATRFGRRRLRVVALVEVRPEHAPAHPPASQIDAPVVDTRVVTARARRGRAQIRWPEVIPVVPVNRK